MKQDAVRFSIFVTRRTLEKLEEICKSHGENRSRVLAELITKEYELLSKSEEK
jgi:hypothetical protein